ncbi:aconitase family protein [Orientia tsutsugamushi str. TA716]|uniref:aconitate hydratase n=1 Tax=Orientia tsutsugamushi str. TA716 TaxID=1359175 RepID=A0A0F3P8W4_ORITS|nr:aconitase family protein [Orientia tsutsugamushi str. TA716]
MQARILMQDYTCVPELVDLAYMRDTVAHIGGDIKKINLLIQIDLIIDSSIQVDVYCTNDAKQKNTELEIKCNIERYEFLRWGANAFQNFWLFPPGTGIYHQVNLEYLSKEYGLTILMFSLCLS